MDKLGIDELWNLTNTLSEKYFFKPFRDNVVYNNRLRTTGGRYIPQTRTIELNPLYKEADLDEFIGIIKHELCHYHLHIEGKGFKHSDQSFKDLLKKTGSPRFCRPLYENKELYKYTYVCHKCRTPYKRTRKVNVERVRCGKCHGKIYLS